MVEVEDIGGEIQIIGWDRAEVKVSGRLASSVEELVVEGSRRRVRIEADTDIPHGGDSHLVINVPAGASIGVDSFSAEITVKGVTGSVSAETVNGSISVTGSTGEVDLETVNGALTIVGPARRVNAESVNGAVRIEGVIEEADASTVNGDLRVTGGTLMRASLETVNGDIEFEGGLSSDASLDAESVGGTVTLVLPASVQADFSLASFSGEIRHDFDAPAARRVSRWTSEQELHFSLGAGGADVSVNTLSGSIYVKKR
jgi:DUF4097 and DUF4098 domain-containing protein YvlB